MALSVTLSYLALDLNGNLQEGGRLAPTESGKLLVGTGKVGGERRVVPGPDTTATATASPIPGAHTRF